jgi:hypothetical protein
MTDAYDRYKTVFYVILTLLLAAGFLGTSLGSYVVSRKGLKNQILSNELPLTSDNIYSEIQRDMLQPIFISSLMANDAFVRNWILDGEKNVGAITQYLSEIQDKYKAITAFLVSDKTFNYYHVSGILKKVHPNEERDAWYFRVRDMKTDYEINVDPDLGNEDALTIFINHKVYGFTGEYLGATGIGYAFASIQKLIAKYQGTYNRTIFFTDRDGRIRLSGGEISGAFSNVKEIEGLKDYCLEILSRPSTSLTCSNHSDTLYLNTRYIPELDWYLWVMQGEEGRIKPIRNILLINLALCIAVTVLAVYLVRILIGIYRKKIQAHEEEERQLRNVTIIQKEEILKKNSELSTKNTRLKEALAEVKTLSGLIPICSSCKKIRDDKGFWEQIESYISAHSDATFSHGICPDCARKLYPDYRKD